MSPNRHARYRPPAPPEPPACAACKSFRPEALVPDGDGVLELCWLCAHHVAEHAVALEYAASARCKCTASDIYPADVLARRHPAPVAPPISDETRALLQTLGRPPSRELGRPQVAAKSSGRR